jgi:uncharacterized membrane protein YeaQ/YmgE (transglycosylase-associated protein family)
LIKRKLAQDADDQPHDSGDFMNFHDILWFLLIGSLAGWVASVLITGSGLGLIWDMAVGTAGAFLGGILTYQLRIAVFGYWEVLGLSIFGAILFLSVLHTFARPREAVSGDRAIRGIRSDDQF